MPSQPPQRPTPKIIVEPGGPPAASTRTGARGSKSGGRRRLWLVVAAVAAVALIAAVVLVVSSGSSTTTPAGPKPSESVQLTVAGTAVQSAGGAVTFPDDVKTMAMATLGSYVEAASVKPLRTGKVDDATLTGLFETTAAAKLTGPDRATLVDEGLPKSSGNIAATAGVTLTGLAGTDGKLVLASASFDLQVVTKVAKGTVRIQRTGSMVLAPLDGTWKITGWHLSVDRNAPGLPATPTTTVAGAPTSKPAATTTTTKK